MKINLSNVGKRRISVVAEPEAEEIKLDKDESLIVSIINPNAIDLEISYGDEILSIYIPDCDGYSFEKFQRKA